MSAPNLVTICVEDEGHRYILHMKADEFLAMSNFRALSAITAAGRFDQVGHLPATQEVMDSLNTRFKLISEGLLEARRALLEQK